MIEVTFNPGLIMVLGAVLVWMTSGALRKLIVLALPVASFVSIWLVPEYVAPVDFMGYPITPVETTALGRLFAATFSIMALGGMIFAMRHSSRTELAAASLYAGSAIGVSMSGNFITLFVFWEMMAIAATIIIFSARTAPAAGAGLRYAAVHVFGGACLLYGIVGTVTLSGDPSLRPLELGHPHTWAVLTGFLVSVGAPPLSAWVADAYPEASAGGSVFLCAFTTKAAVFALLTVFAGAGILIPIGLYMIFYGIIYALLENDMRRILAYSIVNQVGFMVVACGIGTPLAVNAAAAHASAHIIYKALLMMSAGSVLLVTGRRKCTELGGLYASMKVTTLCAIVGAASISAVPLTSGFGAKSLVSASAAHSGFPWLWIALTAAAAGVFLHAGIKFPWFVFFNKSPTSQHLSEAPPNMQIAMILFAVICVFFGLFPEMLYALLPHPVDYTPYTLAHVAEQVQLLAFAALAFFMMLPRLKRTTTISIDFDWLYRMMPKHLANVLAPAGAILRGGFANLRAAAPSLQDLARRRLVPGWATGVPLTALLAASFVLVLAALLLAF